MPPETTTTTIGTTTTVAPSEEDDLVLGLAIAGWVLVVGAILMALVWKTGCFR